MDFHAILSGFLIFDKWFWFYMCQRFNFVQKLNDVHDDDDHDGKGHDDDHDDASPS